MATATTSRRSAARRSAPPQPFTVDHFRLYARQLVLDTGARWEPEDWQLDTIADVFAGTQQVWLLVPQGNGKTTLMAGLALYHCDFTPSPWVPIAASSAKQARILYTAAAEFISRTPHLLTRFKPQDGYLRIKSLANGGWGIQVYAADKDTGQGIQPTLCLVDEGHVHKDLGLYRTWRGKLRKRDGQIVMISTAGEPGTDFEETRDKIRDQATEREQLGPCRQRVVGNRIVMHEFRVPRPEDARDLKLVKAANPLAVITEQELAESLEDPTLDWGEDWLRQTCNLPARSSQAAITDQEWSAAETDERIPEGEPIDVGLDIAWKWDTTAFVPLWMPSHNKRLFGDPIILTPPRDGTMLDPYKLEAAFDEINGRNPVQTVVMDREKGEQFATWLETERGVEVIERSRGNASSAEDYERFMEGLRGGKAEGQDAGEPWIRHTGDPEFRRHAMNAIARKLPSDKRRFDRPNPSRGNARSQDRRVIDALDAASMVHTVAAAGFTGQEPMVAWIGR